MNARKLLLLFLGTSLVLVTPGCLKTRSQIKADNAPADSEVTAESGSRYQMEEIKTELMRLSGKIDEVAHVQQTSNPAEIKEYATRLDARIAEIEKNQLLVMTELKALKDKEAAEAAKVAAMPPANLLEEGNKLLAAKRYEDASEKFKAILAKAPKGRDAAPAHFGLGEAEYGQKNYKRAIVQYSKVQESDAKSKLVPPSLYKIALAFQRLNMSKEAKGFFQELIARYPKSAEAKKAKRKLKD